MSGRKYLMERMGWYGYFVGQILLVIIFGMGFDIKSEYIVMVVFLELAALLPREIIEYRRRQQFYSELKETLEELDKKYLLAEVLSKPEFHEGELLCDVLYETNKSMNEYVNETVRSMEDFKEYLELWIHEIKLPISALSLMIYNENMDLASYRKQLGKIQYDVEQILYYARAGASQKDFLMKKCSIDQLINAVLKEHKEVLIEKRFTIEKENTDVTVLSDAKWLQFMLGQIVHNSTKYRRGERGYLGFFVVEDDTYICLTIEDHGIGIPAVDVERVFDKSFTGTNGRKVASSTGMGLYICYNMCRKLGHEIRLTSEEGVGTKVVMRFGKDDYYLQ